MDALRLVGVVCTDVEELDVGSSGIVAELLSVRGKGVEVVEMEGSEAEVGFDEELPGDDSDDAGGVCEGSGDELQNRIATKLEGRMRHRRAWHREQAHQKQGGVYRACEVLMVGASSWTIVVPELSRR